MQKWEQIVDSSLKKTAQSYKSGMDAQRPDDYTAIFLLEGKGDGKLGLMIEVGAESFNIKAGFENSSKAKKKKNGGWYLNIPFPIATSEAVATSSVFSGKMKPELQKIVQNLGAGESLNPTNVPKELQNIGTRKDLPNFAKYEHKTFDYQGLQHNTKKGHEGYVMFRRVSDKSDENSWIHKGFEPHNFMEKTLNEIDVTKIFEECRDEFLSNRE
jgi:hypothetical protein